MGGGSGIAAAVRSAVHSRWLLGVRTVQERPQWRVPAVFILGLLASLLLASRSQAGADQLNFLARGWLLAFKGEWIPYGLPTSSGGVSPGGASSLLVGLPLLLWHHHRAPVFLILGFHVLAYLALDRLALRTVGNTGRLFFAVFYWLNPWRLYFSGFLNNTLFLFGALHAWTAFHQRFSAGFWYSFLHVVAIGIAFQLHNSFLLLAVASVFLYSRGFIVLHWKGVIAGALTCALLLAPWVLAVWATPSLLPISRGFFGRGLLFVFPLLRGLLYWLRYPSLALGEKMLRLNFTDALGGPLNWVLVSMFFLVGDVIGPVSVLLPILSNVRLWRRKGQGKWRRRFDPSASNREWLKGYVRWCFISAFVVFCLSPTTIMSWQVLHFFHASVFAVILWLGPLSRTRHRVRVQQIVWTYGALGLLLACGMAFGNAQFRCGGPEGPLVRLRADHPMLRDLHLQDTCALPIDDAGGFWPDVFGPH